MTGLFENKTILVTGGAGFIGSALVRQLLDAGAIVRVVDNLVNGKRDNLAQVMDNPRLALHRVDIRDETSMRALCTNAHVVFNLACLGVRHSIHSPRENHEVNATATLQLLQIAREVGAGRFVQVSTSEVYGSAKTAPMTEEHPTFPMTVYGGSKLAGECYARAFYETYRYPTVVVRPFNSYGPRSHHEGDSGEVIPKFMLRCMADQPMVIFGDGRQTRDFTYVDDTAHGIMLAGWHDQAIGQTINLGSNAEISILALADLIKQVLNKPNATITHDAQRPGDVLRLVADSTKAGDLLGFEPRVSMEAGLRRLHQWYAAQDESPQELLQQESVRNWEVDGMSDGG